MRSKAKKQTKLMQIVSAPVKMLSKAKNFYVKGMENCANRVGYGAAIGCSSATVVLPKSFCGNSFKARDDEDFGQLLRAASTRNHMLMESHNKLNSNNYTSKQKEVRQTASQTSGTGRSYSVIVGKIGRIDEDKPCAFEDDGNLKADYSYPRSASHVIKRNFVYQN